MLIGTALRLSVEIEPVDQAVEINERAAARWVGEVA